MRRTQPSASIHTSTGIVGVARRSRRELLRRVAQRRRDVGLVDRLREVERRRGSASSRRRAPFPVPTFVTSSETVSRYARNCVGSALTEAGQRASIDARRPCPASTASHCRRRPRRRAASRTRRRRPSASSMPPGNSADAAPPRCIVNCESPVAKSIAPSAVIENRLRRAPSSRPSIEIAGRLRRRGRAAPRRARPSRPTAVGAGAGADRRRRLPAARRRRSTDARRPPAITDATCPTASTS